MLALVLICPILSCFKIEVPWLCHSKTKLLKKLKWIKASRLSLKLSRVSINHKEGVSTECGKNELISSNLPTINTRFPFSGAVVRSHPNLVHRNTNSHIQSRTDTCWLLRIIVIAFIKNTSSQQLLLSVTYLKPRHTQEKIQLVITSMDHLFKITRK